MQKGTVPQLNGGNSNQVWREGQTVIRQRGPWSSFVHQLLQYLTANGFHLSPVLLDTNATTETLNFIEGAVGHEPLTPDMRSDQVVIEAGQLLRKFHDLTQHFVIPVDSQFLLPVEGTVPHEVICHNDFAPYNCVFRGDHIAGIIDFDTASPGRRIWDVAYAVYRFVPLTTDAHCVAIGWDTPPSRKARLRLFCEAYGLENRDMLIETILQRLEALVQFMTQTASNLAHVPIYLGDLHYIRANRQVFEASLI